MMRRIHRARSAGVSTAFGLLGGALRTLICATLLAALALPVAAGTISGHVHNGTTGKPVPHAEVVLISLINGMEQLTSVQSDAEGGFSFDRPEIGRGPMLVRTTYQGADYFQMSPPGRPVADLEVFEATAPASAVRLASRMLIFQPNGARLLVGEEFLLQNSSKPPATYNKPKGAFEFEIPAGAKLGEVTATPPGGMPLPQGTSDRGKNRYAIDFPLKPGETNFRISYEMPYEGDQTAIRAATLMPTDRVMLAAPAAMKMNGDGFAPAGTDQGYTLMARQNVPAGAVMGITLSGTAPMPPDQGQSAQGGRDSSAAGENLQVLAPRLASFQWIVLGGMGVFFILGFIYLMRQPAAQPAGSAPTQAAAGSLHDAPAGGRAKKHRAAAVPAPAPLPQTNGQAASPAATLVEEAERSVRHNLEELKDKLFRLELRHQAGTITEEDYARERSRLQTVLRELVRG
jgi:hypothetical protein